MREQAETRREEHNIQQQARDIQKNIEIRSKNNMDMFRAGQQQGQATGMHMQQDSQMQQMQQANSQMMMNNAQNFGNVQSGMQGMQNQEMATQQMIQQGNGMMQNEISQMEGNFQQMQQGQQAFHDADAQIAKINQMDQQFLTKRHDDSNSLERANM
jgi:hypothetical protein